MHRCFIAIKPTEEICNRVLTFIEDLKDQLDSELIRWCSKDQLHITLKFLGDVEEERIEPLKTTLRNYCSEFSKFELTISGAGCFPDFSFPRVIWVGMNGELDKLSALQEAVEVGVCEFGDHKEERDFKPHLTIARIKRVSNKQLRDIRNKLQRTITGTGLIGGWQVDNVLLMESSLQPSGAIYQELDSIKLRIK